MRIISIFTVTFCIRMEKLSMFAVDESVNSRFIVELSSEEVEVRHEVKED